MTFDPKDFLGTARYLLERPAFGEAEARTVVGRAYYGAYLVARESLTSRGVITPAGLPADHRTVARALQREVPHLGDVLRSLRDQRNRADYDLTVTITRDLAQQALTIAEAFVSSSPQ